MDLSLLAKGLLIGLSIAAPVGPIGLLCLQRTIDRGRLVGFVSGLGAATADMVYGLAAAVGVGTLAEVMAANQLWLRLPGGLVLVGLGVKTAMTPPAARAARDKTGGLTVAFVSCFFLTIANPLTIIAFSAVFAGLGVVRGRAGLMVAGVFLGSALWWLFLTGLAGLARGRLGEGPRRLVNIGSGLIISGFGLSILIRLILT